MGGGFDGPPPSLPAPKVPKRAGEFTAHPAAPSPYRVRARGACRATPHPEIHILSSWALGGVHGGDIRVKPTRTRETGQPGGGPFGVWGDVLRGGPLPAVSSPRYGYASVGGLYQRARPHMCAVWAWRASGMHLAVFSVGDLARSVIPSALAGLRPWPFGARLSSRECFISSAHWLMRSSYFQMAAAPTY